MNAGPAPPDTTSQPASHQQLSTAIVLQFWISSIHPYQSSPLRRSWRSSLVMPPRRNREGAFLKKKTAEEAKATPGIEGGLLRKNPLGNSDEQGSSHPEGFSTIKDVDPLHDLRVHEHDLRLEKDGSYSHAGAGMFSTANTDQDDLGAIGESVHATDAGEVIHHKRVPTLSGLPLPGGLRPMPIGSIDKIMEDADTDTFIAHKLAGLPGKMQLDRSQTRKYFGNASRDEFFKRFQWMNKQRDKTFKNSEDKCNAIEELIFDNEMNHINHASVSYAFAPVRPERLARKGDHVNYINSKLAKLDGKNKAVENFEQQMKERNEKLKRSETKLKKNITGDPKLDRKLLAKVHDDYQHDVNTITQEYENKMLELAAEDDVFSVADSQVTSTFIDTNEISRLRIENHKGYENEDGQIDIHDDRDKESMGLSVSPRTMYIDGCIRSNLNPRPSLILRKTLTKEMNLQHYSMGDDMGKLLASSLQELPFIQSINLSNNKLTDVSLGPILKAIMEIPNILSLDFSENTTGPIFAQLLADFLEKEDCTLMKLTLKNADVDDYECTNFVNALKKNHSLRELDLSNNLIGSAENLNTVMPDLVTGGEAFADYLDEETSKLESLKLVWNMIRLGGAVDFCNSLLYNDSLTLLDVSYNALSHEGGLTIGNALLSNKKLKTLSLCNNNIDARAAFTICTAIMENHSLRLVHLDGNPIGKAGASSLMRVAVTVGGRTKVTADRCNITMRDPKAWYDNNLPLMKYQLDMGQPYERAILLNLLHLIATHPSYVFRYFNYDQNPVGGKNYSSPKDYQDIDMKSKGVPVDLTQIVVASDEGLMDEYEKDTVKKLRSLKESASDIFLATKLFQEVDVDGGGELDIEEFSVLLTKVGIDVDAARLQETMDMYDTDGGGTIGMVEFFMFLRTQLAEANDRLSDFLDTPIMSVRDSGIKYVPPKEGKVYLEVIDSFKTKDIYKKMTAHDRAKMVEAAKTSTDTTGMINLAVPCFKMRMQEGINTFDNMIAEGGEKVKVAAKIMLQLKDAGESLRFLNRTLKDDPKDWKALKAELRYAVRPILGYPNGYYELDLTDEIDVFTLVRLCELSETMKEQRFQISSLGAGVVGDISQKGNWTCFRNETMIVKVEDEETGKLVEKVEYVEIDSEFAREMPKSGLLKFDFSTSSRPDRLEIQMSDVKLVKFMVHAKLITLREQMSVLDILKDLTKYCSKRAEISAKGIYSCTKAKSAEMGKTVDEFYENLNNRHIEMEAGKKKEEVNVMLDDTEGNSTEKKGNTPSSKGFMKREREKNVPLLSKEVHTKHKYTMYRASFKPKITKPYDSEDEDEEQDPEDSVDGGKDDESLDDRLENDFDGLTKIEIEQKMAKLIYSVEPRRDELTKKLIKLYTSDEVSPEAKGSRMVEVLIDFMAKHYFMCRHLAILIAYFDYGAVKKTNHFGTYNVELVVSMFSRVMDPHNFEVIAHQLSGYELGCVYARLGYLALFNPLKPEGAWELNISRLEERITAKVLCLLSTNEPGRNWIGETFRWERHKDGMPGWELTTSWMAESTMPERGILHCTYYSGEGKGKKKCKVNVNYRYGLMGLFLVNEQEILDQDTDRLNEPMKNEDSKCLKYMKMMSTTYFTYLLNNSQLKKIVYFVPKAADRKKKTTLEDNS